MVMDLRPRTKSIPAVQVVPPQCPKKKVVFTPSSESDYFAMLTLMSGNSLEKTNTLRCMLLRSIKMFHNELSMIVLDVTSPDELVLESVKQLNLGLRLAKLMNGTLQQSNVESSAQGRKLSVVGRLLTMFERRQTKTLLSSLRAYLSELPLNGFFESLRAAFAELEFSQDLLSHIEAKWGNRQGSDGGDSDGSEGDDDEDDDKEDEEEADEDEEEKDDAEEDEEDEEKDDQEQGEDEEEEDRGDEELMDSDDNVEEEDKDDDAGDGHPEGEEEMESGEDFDGIDMGGFDDNVGMDGALVNIDVVVDDSAKERLEREEAVREEIVAVERNTENSHAEHEEKEAEGEGDEMSEGIDTKKAEDFSDEIAGSFDDELYYDVDGISLHDQIEHDDGAQEEAGEECMGEEDGCRMVKEDTVSDGEVYEQEPCTPSQSPPRPLSQPCRKRRTSSPSSELNDDESPEEKKSKTEESPAVTGVQNEMEMEEIEVELVGDEEEEMVDDTEVPMKQFVLDDDEDDDVELENEVTSEQVQQEDGIKNVSFDVDLEVERFMDTSAFDPEVDDPEIEEEIDRSIDGSASVRGDDSSPFNP